MAMPDVIYDYAATPFMALLCWRYAAMLYVDMPSLLSRYCRHFLLREMQK